MIGEKVAHYEILAKLGSGGMGVVYKAQDTLLRSIVALKFLPPELARDDTAKKRLEREAQALASLDHPNICTVHALHETDDGQPYFCMAYYDGVTLSEKLASSPLDVREALRIAHAVATGLEKAHGKGVIHRDLKPGNILITDDDTVKILDFGIARLVDRTKVTRAGVTPGTIHYMSPEQLSGNDADGRSDIFSLGVVLYEMLTGRVPFEADHSDAVSYRIINENAKRITHYRRDVPRSLQKILDKAMEKKPRNRYGSARDFRRDLELVMGKRLPHPRLRRALALALVLLVGAAAAREIIERRSGGLPDEKRLMVLPFTAEANARTDDAVLDGLRETLTEELGEVSVADASMWVLPTSVVRDRRSDDPESAAAVYGVNLLLSGLLRSHSMIVVSDTSRSFAESADSTTIRLTLIDAKDQHTLKTTSVTLAGAIPLRWQSELPEQVLSMLETPIDEADRRRLEAGDTSVPDAYAAYVLGCGLRLDPAQLDAAILQFRTALEHDPAFARAHAALGRACRDRYRETNDEAWAREAVEKSRAALALDDGLATAWTTLGRVHTDSRAYLEAVEDFQRGAQGDWQAIVALASAYEGLGEADRAEATLREAVERFPEDWPLREELGKLDYRLGRYADAAEQYKKVAARTPGYFGIYTRLGAMYLYVGDLENAERALKTGFGIHRSFAACMNLGTIYYRQGRYVEAARMYEWAAEYNQTLYLVWGNLAQAYNRIPSERHKAEEPYRKAIALAEAARSADPTEPYVVAFLAGYYADVGDTATSRVRTEEAVRLGPANPEILFRAGHASAKLGDEEKALRWLGDAIDHGYPVEEILKDPELEGLRSDPRFELLVAKQE